VRSKVPRPAHQFGIGGGAGRGVQARLQGRRRHHFLDDKLENAMIEQAHEPKPFGHRDDLGGAQKAAVGAAHPHQTFIECRPAIGRPRHGPVSQKNPPLVERGDDLVGGAEILPAQRLALDIGPIGQKRAAPLHLRGVERLLRARQHVGDRARMAGRRHAADRRRHRNHA
jgi:hypothetical protein